MTKIKTILEAKNITQWKLYEMIADRCITPIGYDRISKIVNGKLTNYSNNTLLKICYALDVTPNDIIEKEYFIEKECKVIS